jgi:glycosyltransferase involved in cell wall biosynthesis
MSDQGMPNPANMIQLLRKRIQQQKSDLFMRLVWFYQKLSSKGGYLRFGVDRIGIVTREFFHETLNGFGGFGMAVVNLTDFYNTRDGDFPLDVLLAKVKSDHRPLERHHHANVIFQPKAYQSSMDGWFAHLQYQSILLQRNLRLLLTIDYTTAYEPILFSLPGTPVIIWIRDPRTLDDWKGIGTVSLEKEDVRTHPERRVEKLRQSLHRVLQSASKLKRPVLFAYNLESLIEKARDAYALPSLKPFFLPTPIPIPTLGSPKSSRPTICFLGRFDPIKRPWIFFELAKRFKHVNFVAAGITHFPALMNQTVDRYRGLPNLELAGFVHGGVKQELLESSWVLVNTSIHEALPVSFLEAFAAATPVISSVNPGGLVEEFGAYTGEILGDGLDEASLNAVAEKLDGLLANQKERIEKGERARAYVKQMYTFKRFEQMFVDMVTDLE